MATNDCNKTKPCGCEDEPIVSLPPCNPIDCPDPIPCSEVINADCVVYTGTNITCGQSTVVATNSTGSSALQDIVDYFCTLNAALQVQITELTQQIEECCGTTLTPLLVEIVKQGDANRFTAVVAGGEAASYTWSFSSTHNNVDSSPNNSMYTLVPQINLNEMWYSNNASIPNVYDACSSSDAGRVGLLQVTVISTDGRVAKDYKLITSVTCA